jgi:hypothetical protein
MKTLILMLLITIPLKLPAQLCPKQVATRNKIVQVCMDMQLDSLKIEIVKSIAFRESSFEIWSFNPDGSSVGLFGETMGFVIDVNIISGLNYKYRDRCHLRKSIEMLVIYLNHYSDWTEPDVYYKWHRALKQEDNKKYYKLIKSEIKIARL